jgi:hypothetical protein
LTINTATNNQICLQLDAVRNSLFEDLVIKGNWTGTFNANSKGISLSAVSALVTCNDNTFNRINISGFSYGIWSNQEIRLGILSFLI